ncbi:MAG: hypothetical protein K6E50_12215 [Lachnospiraceae bacterium]|nr:hypothetical protein [Lachnospiraceae bacterium]
MKKMIWAVILSAALWLGYAALASAGEDEGTLTQEDDGGEVQWIDITTPEELASMQEGGAYRLAADLDMSGTDWTPLAFQGKFDGNGYAILNLRITQTGSCVRSTYDGNMVQYDTYFTGFFDALENAEVTGLRLINLRIDVDTDKPCFAGGIAGYMEKSSISDSSVQGILSLKAHERMFGVGGMIGYGCGSIERTRADVTLVNIDTDASTKDEQFMGGACAAGYPDVNDCEVVIAGFDSDHGYVHDGGLIGMYIFYPRGTVYHGKITNNHVSGKIRFFEDNTNRRAYCKGFIGEIMVWEFDNAGNETEEFVRDEIFTYDKDILPHECDSPSLKETVTEASCDFGFTTISCENCGYTETDHYTLKSHDYEWTVVEEAKVGEKGLRHGVCRGCGAETDEEIPELEIPEGVKVLEPEDAAPTVAVVEEVPTEAPPEKEEKKGGGAWIVIALLAAGAVTAVFLLLRKRK